MRTKAADLKERCETGQSPDLLRMSEALNITKQISHLC